MAGLKRTTRLSTPTAGAERIGVVSDQDHLRTELEANGRWADCLFLLAKELR